MIIREAVEKDIKFIQEIYNQGIEDRVATLETELKDVSYMNEWFDKHSDRYKILVAEHEDRVIGWASLNQYNNRLAYKGVADLSIYIAREYRGRGIGGKLLPAIEQVARDNGFHKIVLFTFPSQLIGQELYKKQGYKEVGTFRNQGILDGEFVDVMAMEKLL